MFSGFSFVTTMSCVVLRAAEALYTYCQVSTYHVHTNFRGSGFLMARWMYLAMSGSATTVTFGVLSLKYW
ncbi:MAG: hypothetical protein QXP98_04015 [Thermoproteus sp.]